MLLDYLEMTDMLATDRFQVYVLQTFFTKTERRYKV